MRPNPLRVMLDKRSINIADLARKADVPKTTLYSVTGGRGDVWNMGLVSVVRIAHALGMTVDEFVAEVIETEAALRGGSDAADGGRR